LFCSNNLWFSMSEQTGKPAHRLIFIDVMRGIAVLLMIETHVLDATLYSAMKSGWFYHLLNIANGMIAVSFLFCAGAGFWLAISRKLDDYLRFKPSLWQYLKRLFIILFLGYWLHQPFLSIRKLITINFEQALSFFQCDILHTIVISSLLALIIVFIIPKTKVTQWIYLAIPVIIYVLTPFAWASDSVNSLGVFFGPYLAKPPISKFPLFPWMGHFFMGAGLTALFFNTENKRKFAWIVLIAGIIIAALLNITNDYQFHYGYFVWWDSSPGHAFFRIFIVAAVFMLLYLIENSYREKRIGSILQKAGQTSLFIYAFHLLIVYGSVSNFGLKKNLFSAFGPLEVILVTILIAFTSYAVAIGWKYLQQKEQGLARLIGWSFIALYLGLVIISPW
ncbi:MAG: hypothetical protein QG635_291, partial [Bacteroidota bacterium]|nr:hypothetical protein [Bacteroidota bacterium]